MEPQRELQMLGEKGRYNKVVFKTRQNTKAVSSSVIYVETCTKLKDAVHTLAIPMVWFFHCPGMILIYLAIFVNYLLFYQPDV